MGNNNVDNTKKLQLLSFCTGYGGIERGLELAKVSFRTITHVEIEAFAIANLVDKMEQGRMVPAPIWTDVKTLPLEPFRDRVDILTGGYPCQPFSAAGQRKGAEDPRHLWPYILKAIDVIRPRRVFFENVEGHITLGLREVIRDLETRGYNTTWGIFSACEVGASHQRKRVFILANSRLQRQKERQEQTAGVKQSSEKLANSESGQSREQETGNGGESIRRGSQELGNTEYDGSLAESELRCDEKTSDRRKEKQGKTGEFKGADRSTYVPSISGCKKGSELADSKCKRLQRHRISADEQIQEGRERKRRLIAEESHKWPARPAEKQYEWEESRTVKSSMGRTANGTASRVDELRLLGNGVVPQTAALAWKILNERLNNDKTGVGEK